MIGAFVVIGTFPGELADDFGRRVAKEAQFFSQSLEGYPNPMAHTERRKLLVN
jgi:hypothetical protein